MKKITIAGSEYTLRYTLKSLIVFRRLQEKSEVQDELANEALMYYAILIANNQETFKMPFDEFTNMEVYVLEDIREWYLNEQRINELLSGKQEEPDADGEKKNT
ncbi:hypothetical protein Barb6_03048 [Bacteroidales bacterium Barb6]|nr:hypothetical protein Barb6_03048 [Bacteroidales bacterium Barb6]